jgi:hypothetical protein
MEYFYYIIDFLSILLVVSLLWLHAVGMGWIKLNQNGKTFNRLQAFFRFYFGKK